VASGAAVAIVPENGAVKVGYVDMIGGAAGDMLMGAWVDAGVDAAVLERALRTVVADGWELVTERVDRAGISAIHLDLVIPGEDDHAHTHGPDGEHYHEHVHHGHRLRDILAIVERSGLTARQIERASAIYRRLAEAEARVHGQPVDEVIFHEVGQIDAILDVAGTCIALDLLEIEELRCSAFPTGHGLVRMAHGAYPNPGPASLDLMRGFPLRATDIEAELVTVTGAAILTTLATPGPALGMTLERIGYGAGRKKFAVPNVVRVMTGERTAAAASAEVVVIEANIDDMSPQHYELALERIFAAGAHDAWLTPITMKKGRPAITLAALADPSAEKAVAEAMLRETTTIGVRVRTERRHVLAREMATVDTPFGTVRVKRVAGDGVARWQAEYDDLLRIARERNLPLSEVTRAVTHAAGERP
jgi:uncharacterized protein (TIGR00299 family) protein